MRLLTFTAGDEFEAISDEEVDRLIEADIRHFASLDDLAPNGSLFELTEGRNYTGGTFERLVNGEQRRLLDLKFVEQKKKKERSGTERRYKM